MTHSFGNSQSVELLQHHVSPDSARTFAIHFASTSLSVHFGPVGAASTGTGAVTGSAMIGDGREQPMSKSVHERMTMAMGLATRQPWSVKTLAVIAALLLVASSASAQSAWDDVPRDKKGRPWPERLKYRGGPVPNGYHIDTHTRDGLIVGGSIMFGVTYALCAYTATQSDREGIKWYYAPVVGPFVYASTGRFGTPGFDVLVPIFAGMLQAGGAAMAIIGFVPKTDLARNDIGRIQVVPVVAHNQQGLAVVGTF